MYNNLPTERNDLYEPIQRLIDDNFEKWMSAAKAANAPEIQQAKDLTPDMEMGLCLCAGLPFETKWDGASLKWTVRGKVGFGRPRPDGPWVVYTMDDITAV